jgi:hypothetical protein
MNAISPSSRSHGSGSQLLAFMAGVFLLVGVGLFIYLFFFTNLVPLGGPAMDKWQVSPDFTTISDGQYRWTISYEASADSQYRGRVRHATPDRMGLYPLISHDVLVTSGDYADPALVQTSVDILLHRFTWRFPAGQTPNGRINLLHTVPYSPEIYRLLLKIRNGDQVVITGREVARIQTYDLQANHDLGYWQDDGCNTLVVTGVEWINNQ